MKEKNNIDVQWKPVIQGCIRNERKHQEKLYRHFFPIMERMVYRYTRDEDQVIDILNNGFLRVFKKVDRYEHKGSFEGWIRKLIFNSLSDYFRKSKKDVRIIVFEDYLKETKSPDSPSNNLYYEDLLLFVKKLPAKQMKVFHMYAIEGYLHKEIGAQLGMSENTSKWYLSEARKHLQTLIKKHYSTKNYEAR